jgi:hypothetical protein
VIANRFDPWPPAFAARSRERRHLFACGFAHQWRQARREPDPASPAHDTTAVVPHGRADTLSADAQETAVSLHDELKTRVNAAVKAGDTPTRDTFRTVLGEAQMEALRRKGDVTDEIVLGVVRKGVAELALG